MLRQEFKEGESVRLDKDFRNTSIVEVVSQTSGKLYTTVTSEGSTWDVMTNRLTKLKENENMKEKFIEFMMWYKNNIPIGTQDNSKTIVEKYLISVNKDKVIICEDCDERMIYDPKFDIHACYNLDCITSEVKT